MEPTSGPRGRVREGSETGSSGGAVLCVGLLPTDAEAARL